ncbi:MAG: iron complex transport system substrate-binding protein [Solirubrobacterales bacterium]|jgi:iron complex transport system substrate-binding protein|nr:iron complex transport system substrate-binding protein [Solirubrobacterales bacterium]
MRIASLVPSATEALFSLGLGDDVVAVTHECDWPAAALERPRLTRSEIPEGLSPREIDEAVRELTAKGEAIYGLDSAELERLEPDLIVTQALCAVCAVSYDDVCSIAGALPGDPSVLSLDPETLDEVLGDLVRLGAECGVPERGDSLRRDLRRRLDAVRAAVEGAPRPRVVALEWLDPPFIGGHWVPEMIEAAGGVDALGEAGVKSRTGTWDELRAAAADVAVVMPCGLYADEAAAQAGDHAGELEALNAKRIWAVDAASSFSRPGPRLVDGVELLAHLLHPDRAEAPPGLEFRRL